MSVMPTVTLAGVVADIPDVIGLVGPYITIGLAVALAPRVLAWAGKLLKGRI